MNDLEEAILLMEDIRRDFDDDEHENVHDMSECSTNENLFFILTIVIFAIKFEYIQFRENEW